LKFICEIELNTAPTKRFGHRYHGNVPILDTFARKTGVGYWIRRFGCWLTKAKKTEVPARPQTESTALVMQAHPAVLAQMALELHGVAVPGDSVEITIVPAASTLECQTNTSMLV
jgi:hypothetical protein